MQLKRLLTDDEAVSPVIGVILMVAITVILAAVIGTFVLGLGDQVQSTSPQASFQFDFADEVDGNDYDQLEATHDGGDSIAASKLSAVSDSTAVDLGTSAPGSAEASGDTSTDEAFDESDGGASGDVEAGTTVFLATESGNELNSATIRITWADENGDNTATLGKWDGPSA